MTGLIWLMDRGVLDPKNSKVSWDGLYSTELRVPKNPIHDDKFFNNQIKLLGNSGYGCQLRVRTAITPANINHLARSLKFLLNNGCTKWEYYFLEDCQEYKKPEFIHEFRNQLSQIMDMYYTKPFTFINYKDKYSLVSKIPYCKNMEHSLAIDIDGNVYLCLGHIAKYKNLSIGNIKDGCSKEMITKFTKFVTNTDTTLTKIRNDGHCPVCKLDSYSDDKYISLLAQTQKLKDVEIDIYFNNGGEDIYV